MERIADPDLIKYLTPTELDELDFLISWDRLFKETYHDDPVAFVHDCFDWEGDSKPAPYQEEVLANIPLKKRVSVRGPHGLGKTTLAAWAVLWFALTRDGDDWKVPMTASSWRQLSKYLLPEIHKWSRRLKWAKIGREPFDDRSELLVLNLKLETGEAFALASSDAALLEGAHADSLFYVLDEARAIPDDTFDAAEGAFSGAGEDTGREAFALAVSTPGEPVGRFYDIQKRKPGFEDWWVRHVKLEEAIAAGRISRKWADQRKRQWGEKSAVYQNRVVGEFAADSEEVVIPLAWVELANERWHEWVEAGRPGKFVCVGADIGGGGENSDKTVLALAYEGYKVGELRKYPRGDIDTATMETVGRIKGILEAKGGKAVIDVVGIGLGVYHRLRELGHKNALAFNAGKSTDRRDKTGEFGFFDRRSAAWWLLRELLDPEEDIGIALPPDDELTGELTTPKKQMRSGARIKVEDKESIKTRLKGRRSTDNADAVIQSITGPELCDTELTGQLVF